MSARARSSEGSGGSQQRCCPRPARPHGGESIPQSVLPLPRRWALCRSATGAHRAGARAGGAVPPLCNQSSSRLLWMEINAVPKPPVSWAAVPPLPYTLSPSCNPRGTETRSTAGGAAGSPPRAWPSPASGAVPWSLGGPRPLPPASPPPGQGHSRTQRVLSHLPCWPPLCPDEEPGTCFIIACVALRPSTQRLFPECSRRGRGLVHPGTRGRVSLTGFLTRRVLATTPCAFHLRISRTAQGQPSGGSQTMGTGWGPGRAHTGPSRGPGVSSGCRSPRPEHAVRDGRRVLSPMRGACPQRPCPSSCGARAGLPGRKPEQPRSPAFVHGEPCPPPRVCLPQAWPISAGFSRDRGDAHRVPFLQCWGQN